MGGDRLLWFTGGWGRLTPPRLRTAGPYVVGTYPEERGVDLPNGCGQVGTRTDLSEATLNFVT